jgi:hypothetical protein
MNNKEPFFPQADGFSTVDQETGSSAIRAIATQDHGIIRRWAARHHAEPAIQAETIPGASPREVSDGGTIVRFNFPAAGHFGPVTWDAWFAHFDRLHLTFVYEEEVVDRAYELYEARGGTDGHDRDDWAEAAHRLGGPPGSSSARYRFVPQDEKHQEEVR